LSFLQHTLSFLRRRIALDTGKKLVFKIGSVAIKNRVVVAPMAGISNPPFRRLVAHYDPGLIYTEMVSDRALVYQNQRTLGMTQVFDDERPIALQIFGENIDTMVKAAVFLDQHTACDIIDINMGCPVPKIVKGSGGAALMKDPEHAVKLASAVVQAVQKPVTVKTRLGWDEQHINVLELAKELERVGVAALAVHGRTRAQGYSGQARFEEIAALKAQLSIPLIANGDIRDVAQARQVLNTTQADGIMVGRAILGQPWLVRDLVLGLAGRQAPDITLQERFDLARSHAQGLVEHKGEAVAIKEMRGHMTWYLKGLPNSHAYKDAIAKMNHFHEFDTILTEYLEDYQPEGRHRESTN
jgi:nifR3 family TIM-barrel protein